MMNRHIAEVRRNVDRLDLIQETARHNEHLTGAPVIPFGDQVHAPILEQMVAAARLIEDAEHQAQRAKKQIKHSQFGEHDTVDDYEFLPE